MLARALMILALLSSPARAEDPMVSGLRGVYGSDENEDYSCAFNPVTLDFMAAPPHAIFRWDFPTDTVVGPARTSEVYDLIGPVEGGLLLRLEGDPRRAANGGPPLWILRPMPDFSGFCWGRQDWPLLRCISPHHRCTTEAPVS